MSAHGTYYRYAKMRCRCESCRAAASERRSLWPSEAARKVSRRVNPGHPGGRSQPGNTNAAQGRPDDGIIDEVVIERLMDGGDWREATFPERKAAAAIMFARGWCWQDVETATNLRSQILSELKAQSRVAS